MGYWFIRGILFVIQIVFVVVVSLAMFLIALAVAGVTLMVASIKVLHDRRRGRRAA